MNKSGLKCASDLGSIEDYGLGSDLSELRLEWRTQHRISKPFRYFRYLWWLQAQRIPQKQFIYSFCRYRGGVFIFFTRLKKTNQKKERPIA